MSTTRDASETELESLIQRLYALCDNPRQGLPHEVFKLVSQLTPLINVDLLIRDDSGQTLLTWRADEFHGPGWHVPGGIIRFKESIAARIAKVAAFELGSQIDFDATPLAIHELTNPQRDVRGHFISLLHACRLLNPPAAALKFEGKMPKQGQWRWHDHCPDNLIRAHEVYRPYIDRSYSPTAVLTPSRKREETP